MKNLKSSQLNTPLGPMLAIADRQALYALEFLDQNRKSHPIEKGSTDPIDSIREEIDQYFKGSLKEFKTPLALVGSDFQKKVWTELQKIPFGQTRSYADLSLAIDRPSSFRAVAKANSTNRLPLIIPCHRVIYANGQLGGYNAGIFRKKWLLEHEREQ